MMALEAAWGSGVPWLLALEWEGGGGTFPSVFMLPLPTGTNRTPPPLIVFSDSNYIRHGFTSMKNPAMQDELGGKVGEGCF